MKIHPVGAELFHAGGRTNRTGQEGRQDEVSSRFSQFCKYAYEPSQCITERSGFLITRNPTELTGRPTYR